MIRKQKLQNWCIEEAPSPWGQLLNKTKQKSKSNSNDNVFQKLKTTWKESIKVEQKHNQNIL